MKHRAPTRTPGMLAATSAKTVVTIAGLIAVTTAATAGVVLVGSQAITDHRAAPPAAAGYPVGSNAPSPVVVIPRSPTTTAAPNSGNPPPQTPSAVPTPSPSRPEARPAETPTPAPPSVPSRPTPGTQEINFPIGGSSATPTPSPAPPSVTPTPSPAPPATQTPVSQPGRQPGAQAGAPKGPKHPHGVHQPQHTKRHLPTPRGRDHGCAVGSWLGPWLVGRGHGPAGCPRALGLRRLAGGGRFQSR